MIYSYNPPVCLFHCQARDIDEYPHGQENIEAGLGVVENYVMKVGRLNSNEFVLKKKLMICQKYEQYHVCL